MSAAEKEVDLDEMDEEALLNSDENTEALLNSDENPKSNEMEEDEDALLNDTVKSPGKDAEVDMSDDNDDSSDEDNEEEQQNKLEAEYKAIVEELNTNPYVYDKYLRLCELSHELGELDLIRTAYTKFAAVFPLTPQLWLKYINIELGIAQSEDEINRVDLLFQKALGDYFSIEVALEYAEFARLLQDPEKQWLEILGTYGTHCLRGQEFFKRYREFNAKQDNLSAEQKQQLYINSFLLELKFPLKDMEQSYIEFKVFYEKNKTSKLFEGVEWSPIDAKYFKAKDALNKILPYEMKLQELGSKLYRERAALYTEYIKEADKFLDENILQIIYERMVADCCLDVDCWLTYIEFVDYRDAFGRPQELFDHPVYLQNAVDLTHRALKNCSWSEQLYIKLMQLLEKAKKSREEIQEVLEMAMAAGFQTPEPAVAIWTEYLTYLRRTTDWESEAECDVLRKNFNLAWTILGKQWGVLADCNCEILKFWGRLEYGPLQDAKRGKDLWSTVMESSDNSTKSGLWIELAELEMSRDLDATRKLYRKALHSAGLDNPLVICSAWMRFERCNGSLKSVANCLSETNEFIASYQEQIKQTESSQKAKKRKTEDPPSQAKKPRVLMEDEMPQKRSPKKGKAKIEERFQSHENEEIDLTKDHLRIFLSNLDYSLDEEEIREGLPELNIRSIDLIRSGNGRSRGFGYLELETVNDVDTALGMDRRSLKGRPVFISSVLRDKEKRQKFKYSDGVEPKKLFVKGLPPDATKEDVSMIFSPIGELADVRLVYHKSGKFKNIAYVEFSEESAASKAVMATDGLEIRGHALSVAISAPPPKPTASAAPNPLKMLGVAGRRPKTFDQKPRMSLIPNVLRKKLATASAPAPEKQTNGSQTASGKTNEEFRKLLEK